MAREGWLFVGPGLAVAGITAAAAASGWNDGWVVCVPVLLITGFLAFFFRDPGRHAPSDESVVVAPADGRILVVATRPDGTTQIDTFLSVMSVHVNRAPIGGCVVSSEYRPGKFFAAMRPEAAAKNERQDVVLESPLGTVRFAQIAGTLARRIVCRLRPGDNVNTGDRIGMIRFGSRMEVIVPPGVEPTVVVGQRVRAGESIIARQRSEEKAA
jgi:phosphatidylserine decarboxylase